jgi:hypothetical protein
MGSRVEESILNHGVAISRIEDCEDDMNVCKGDIDMIKIEQVSRGQDICMLEGAMGGTQEDLVTNRYLDLSDNSSYSRDL